MWIIKYDDEKIFDNGSKLFTFSSVVGKRKIFLFNTLYMFTKLATALLHPCGKLH